MSELALETLKGSIQALENTLKGMRETVEPEIMHHFAVGTYCRTMLGKAGDMIVGKCHRKDHIAIVSAGRAIVVSEEHGRQDVSAPAVIYSAAGAKRAFYVVEDLIWTTVHENPTNTKDLIVLEAELIEGDL